MKKFGILTSGGDAPGMNAAIRAFVRESLNSNLEVIGFKNGYEGLIGNDFIKFDRRSVGNIIQRGGSILHTSRSARFLKKKYRIIAANNLKDHRIDGLAVIGGEGSLNGASELSKVSDVSTVVIPATIDRDMPLVGPTIGFDTAINTALSAIDKIRDTATTANVTHIVEVMGRNCGWLSILAGIGAGAEVAIIPEIKIRSAKLAKRLKQQLEKGKKGCILILAEGGFKNGGDALAKSLSRANELDLRVTTLGHIQRGGNPSAADRLLASELGISAVFSLLKGKKNIVLAKPTTRIEVFSFEEILLNKVSIDKNLYGIIESIA